MARQPSNGIFGKIIVFISFVLSVLCTVYIGLDIMGKSGNSAKIGQIGTFAEEGRQNADKALKNTEAIKQQYSRQISNLESQNRKLESAVAEMSLKLKETGIQWTKNFKTGNQYCLTPYPLPWHLAQKWAQDQGGNLVVINDQEENDWIVKTFGGQTEYWIGMTDEKTEGKWFWVIGAPVQYFSWLKGEPDNYKNEQHYGITNCKSPGMWNDVIANEPRIGIVEKK